MVKLKGMIDEVVTKENRMKAWRVRTVGELEEIRCKKWNN